MNLFRYTEYRNRFMVAQWDHLLRLTVTRRQLCAQLGTLHSYQTLSLGHGAQNKSNVVSGSQLCGKEKICRNHDSDLGIASGGLPVGHQEDRLPIRGDL